jgi:hypothetical protein
MHEHPAEGELQALFDRELPKAQALAVRAHLLRCAACRARANAARETAALVNALLRRTTPKADGDSAWEQLAVRSGGRAATVQPGVVRWTLVAGAALAAAALLSMMTRSPSSPGGREDPFALVREAHAHPASSLLRDACCSDHDGGDRPDDGLLTLSSVGEKVTVVIVYEDVDRSGTFTHGDIVRYVSTTPRGTPVARGVR